MSTIKRLSTNRKRLINEDVSWFNCVKKYNTNYKHLLRLKVKKGSRFLLVNV